jgi:hypothetical protein
MDNVQNCDSYNSETFQFFKCFRQTDFIIQFNKW